MMKRLITLIFSLMATTAHAEITHHTFDTYIQQQRFYYQDGPFIEPIKGALSWDVFATTTEKNTEKNSAPDFALLTAYANKEVTLYGYMFTMFQKYPLQHFIMGPYPSTCPFHYHVHKNLIVNIVPEKPVTYTDKPLLIKGTLHLIRNNSADGFATLEHAVILE